MASRSPNAGGEVAGRNAEGNPAPASAAQSSQIEEVRQAARPGAEGAAAELVPAAAFVPETIYDYDDGGAPIGPSEEEESAFLAEASSQTGYGDLEALARSEDEERSAGPLPSLDELRGRIAPEVLGLMEELFRAKLTRVQRVNKRDLKEAKRSQ